MRSHVPSAITKRNIEHNGLCLRRGLCRLNLSVEDALYQ